jgi:hypothetical protein
MKIETDNQATVYDWYVNEPVSGISYDHLKELSNWYRVDNSIFGPSVETSLHTLTKISQITSNTNADPHHDTLTVLYEDSPNEIQIRVIFNITDGGFGSGISQLDEDIRIFNMSDDPLDIHFFEYVDLNLHNTPNNDEIELTAPGSLYQHDLQTDYFGGFEADRYELNYFSTTVDKLNDGVSDDLNDAAVYGPGPIGPGNVTWALQWDFAGDPPGTPPGFRHRIPAHSFASIHKEGILKMYYVAVPEPTSAGLAALGGLAMWLHRRRRVFG